MQNTSVISREIVNKNIIFRTSKGEKHTFDDLCRNIDGYKNLLQKKYNVKKGQTVLNALVGFDATSFFIASCELGMITIISSVTLSSKNLYYESKGKWLDAKTSQVMPIDFMVTRNKLELIDSEFYDAGEEKFYKDISTNIISGDDIDAWSDFSSNKKIDANPDDIIMRCTSSGTTGIPKKIEHTHDFMSRLSIRNSKTFFGNIVLTKKFMHGSSFATFFLPTLVSKNVDNILDSRYSKRQSLKGNQYRKILAKAKHIQFPYTNDVESFLSEDISYPNLIVYTLAAIRPEWLQYVGTKVKDIVSMYGMSETSGPVLVNKASDINFAPNKFYPLDDFYKLNIKNKHLIINGLETSDKFTRSESAYVFHGRDDLIRVNDVEVPLAKYNSYISDGTIVVDTLYNKIYLAMWGDIIDISELQSKLDSHHTIDKFASLNKKMFMSGIKLDMQALREFFRSATIKS